MAGLLSPDIVDWEDEDSPPKDWWSFYQFLAFVYNCDKKELSHGITIPDIDDIDFESWLKKFDPVDPLPKTANDPLNATLPIPLGSGLGSDEVIHITKDRISGDFTSKKGAHTVYFKAFKMAIAAKANPVMREKGIVLEGSKEEQAILYAATQKMGLNVIGVMENGRAVKFDKKQIAELEGILSTVQDGIDKSWEKFKSDIDKVPDADPKPAPASVAKEAFADKDKDKEPETEPEAEDKAEDDDDDLSNDKGDTPTPKPE